METNRLINLLCLLSVGLLSACQPAQWKVTEHIAMDGVAPIGLAAASNGNLWISDGDHNRVLLVDQNGKMLREIAEIERPMHIHGTADEVFVPSYGSDEILRFANGERQSLEISEELDAPAAYHREGSKEAIADFYSNSILYKNGKTWKRLGKEGQVDGTFRYPTDLQWYQDKLYVADAYNHRVQVFDAAGKHLLTFGEDEDMNATTGVFVHAEEVIVTDFENSRILFYDLKGEFLYSLDTGFDKPTDIVFSDEKLFVSNYRSGKLTVLRK